MKYLLDTDTCVFWLKGNDRIEQKVLSVGMDNVALSFINVSELYYGAYKSQRIEANLAMVRRLTEQFDCRRIRRGCQRDVRGYEGEP